MSHDYSVYCPRCRASSEEFNHGQAELVDAVKASWPLWLLRQTKWGNDLWNLGYGTLPGRGLAAFILQHWNCGGFLVVSEYWQEGDLEREAKYPPMAVSPEVPGGYEAHILPAIIKEAEALAQRLLILAAAAKGETGSARPMVDPKYTAKPNVYKGF